MPRQSRKHLVYLLVALAARRAAAGTVNFTGASPLWSDPAAWDTGSAPVDGDDVVITNNSPINLLTFDTTATTANLNSVIVDAIGSVTLAQTANTFSTAVEYIGYTNSGSLSVTGGTHNVGGGVGQLYFGYQAGSFGSATLSGTINAGSVYVGYAGTGVFTQTGGNHTLGNFLSLGGQPDGGGTSGSGTYNLNNGSLSLNTLYTGLAGTGIFNQTGGSTSFGASETGYLPGSSGTVNLMGGSFFNVGDEIYGDAGQGTLNQVAGSHLTASLTLGNQASGSGVANITGGSFVVDGVTKVGNNGTGVINQSGGLQEPLDMYVGLEPGSSGIYNLSNGATVHVQRQVINGTSYDGYEYLGYFSNGVFNQSGGTHIVDVYFAIGRSPGGSGTYNLNGGLLLAPAESIGYQNANTNVFNQTAGSNGAKVFLTVGDQTGTQGVYNLSGASSILNVADLYDSWAGFGTFNQSNGAAIANHLYLAHESTAVSSYNLSGGTFTTLDGEDIGYHGAGTFNQTGGLHAANPTATVSIKTFATNGAGTYNLSGGTFTAGVVVNKGLLNLTGGSATFTTLSDSGTTTLAGTATLTVNAFAQNQLSIAGHALVTVLPSSTTRVTNTVSQLSITGGALDLGNQNLLAPITTSTIRSYLSTGSIFSTSANQSGGTRTLGYASSADTVAGNVSIPAGQTLVKYTVPGDADLSGTTDFNDFLIIQNNFNKPGDWAQGDFDYNGTVDFNDFLIFQNNFIHSLNGNGTATPAELAAINAFAISNVPEPSLALATAAALLVRRRKRCGKDNSKSVT